MTLLEFLNNIGERRAARAQRPRDIRQFIGSVEPCPSCAPPNVSDGAARNTKPRARLSLRNAAAQGSDGANTALVKYGLPVPRSSVGRAVLNAVHLIFKSCSPAKMPRIDAGFVPIPATVGYFVGWRRRQPMNFLAGEAADKLLPTIPPHGDAASAVAERPSQAAFACKWQDGLVEKSRYFSSRRNNEKRGERVAVLTPTLIVHRAPPARATRLATLHDRTYSRRSHGAVLSRGGQGRALHQQRSRPAFCRTYPLVAQGITA